MIRFRSGEGRKVAKLVRALTTLDRQAPPPPRTRRTRTGRVSISA